MTRNDLEFQIGYSSRYERMSANFFGRMDRAISLIQICLGASAFADFANLKVIGIILTITSVWALIYQPGPKAALAEVQRQQYDNLCSKMSSLSDDELAAEYAKIQERDGQEIGGLCDAAYYNEYIRLGQIPPQKLGIIAKSLAWIVGDLQCHQFHRDL